MENNTVVQRIEELLIQVPDIERSVEFYRDGLGIPFQPTYYGDDSYEAKIGEVRLLLHPDFDNSLHQARRGVGIYIHLWVPDVDAYRQELQKRGVQILEEPEDRPWGRHMSIIDPDGYRIDILGPVGGASEGQ